MNDQFLNSLRLTWSLGLFADAAVLLRQLALLESPAKETLLENLLPKQGVLDLSL